ncbi:MAG TPA: hydroxyisourate hydrolase [Jiangellaceae bacterium]
MSTVTTHVLDTSRGRPAAGVPVALEDADGNGIGSGATDADGRINDLGPDDLPSGTYRLLFGTAAYLGDDTFYPEVTVTFRVTAGEHHHVPLLLSRYGYTTYRGS